jgi:hypothetical protein
MARWVAVLVLVIAIGGGASRAQDAAKPAESPIAALKKELDAKARELRTKFTDAKDDAEKGKIRDEFRKVMEEGQKKLTALALEKPADPEAVEILAMVIAEGDEKDKNTKAALDAIMTHHVASPKIKPMVPMFGQIPKGGDPILKAIEEKNPDKTIKAQAALTLGTSAKGKAKEAKGEERAGLIKAAEASLARVKTYVDAGSAEGKKLIAQVNGALAGVKNIDLIEVGKPVPDIEGVDTEGKKFKLSDYKGKVVLLDYWAFW